MILSIISVLFHLLFVFLIDIYFVRLCSCLFGLAVVLIICGLANRLHLASTLFFICIVSRGPGRWKWIVVSGFWYPIADFFASLGFLLAFSLLFLRFWIFCIIQLSWCLKLCVRYPDALSLLLTNPSTYSAQ